jgi:hypothetical protein
MGLGDKVAVGFFALGMAFAMTVWFNWVSQNDDHVLAVADCMSKVQHKQNISPQQAFLICERSLED